MILPRILVFAYDTHNHVRYTLYIFNRMLFRFVLVPFSQDETSLTSIVIILCEISSATICFIDLTRENESSYKRMHRLIYLAFES